MKARAFSAAFGASAKYDLPPKRWRAVVGMAAPAAVVLILISALVAGCSDRPETRGAAAGDAFVYPPQPAGQDGPAAGCVVCHSLAKDGTLRSAPPLWGIVGAKKARFDWYGYSLGLATAGGDWTEQDLDQYLTDPGKFLPGTTKTLIGIGDPQERADLIAFLKDLRD